MHILYYNLFCRKKKYYFDNFPFFACKMYFHLLKYELLKKSVKEVLSWLNAQFVKKVLISEIM